MYLRVSSKRREQKMHQNERNLGLPTEIASLGHFGKAHRGFVSKRLVIRAAIIRFIKFFKNAYMDGRTLPPATKMLWGYSIFCPPLNNLLKISSSLPRQSGGHHRSQILEGAPSVRRSFNTDGVLTRILAS